MDRPSWHPLRVLLDKHLINYAIAIDAIHRLHPDDLVIIDMSMSSGILPVVRDRSGISLGVITNAARHHVEGATGMILPNTALFDRTLEFGFLVKVRLVGIPMQSTSMFWADTGLRDQLAGTKVAKAGAGLTGKVPEAPAKPKAPSTG